ncbi:hypothetical protein HYH02_007605 [Chlamydomonas schloesseri]|uniref:DUF4378 domain-containing protein n=1 Tax=Chlamydomonas schloesseri TaxID=2026947 RepID=A0A836B4C7_9CHLO|nr:hypothetical protein HYH02_007605 [Chlamydomonas schloesseri]|eukprot:KAG2447275.1 hypothetical protein HYH02_007605 [Chlamydomonas schloesseri]
MASFGEEAGRGRSGHVSGRILSNTTSVRGPPAPDVPRASTRRRTGEQTASAGGARTDSWVSSASLSRPTGAALHNDDEAHSSDESFDSAPPRRKAQPINAELVKLVASFAPLELAQLKAMEQKARLKKARAAAAATGGAAPATTTNVASGEEAADVTDAMEEDTAMYADPAYDDVEPEAPAPVPESRRTSAAGHAANAHGTTSRGRSKSPGPGRPSHLPAAPAKGAVVKRDLNILPNPVASKQTEAIQRQQAVTNFVHRLQKEQDAVRAEKDRRLQAEKEALAAQVAEATEAAKAAAAQVTSVPEPKPPPIKKKKPAAASGTAAGLQGMQAIAAEAEPEKKPVDPRPWRQNMKRRPTQISGDAPTGAPPDVGPIPMTSAPPPRSVSPSAAAAKMRTLDPVARMQLKEFMDRKAKETSMKQAQERAAQQEAKTAHLRVVKAEMAKARERAQKYAETNKDHPPATRPAWVDIAPGENAGTALLNRPAPARRPPQDEPDFDIVSDRALPHHMSDAMRMEVIERRRRERLQGPGSPQRGARSVLVDDFGNPIDSDMESGPQVVRVHDPDMSGQTGRVYRAGSARPTRPLVTAPQRPASAHPAVRPVQPLPPPPAASSRALDLEARLAARKLYDQQLREMQAAERRDSSRGRDTSRGRDNSRGRNRSPAAGRKHHSSTVHSHSRSRSPHKRAKQGTRRSRSGSRAGSASRRKSTAPGGAGGSAVSAVHAELQQARNEQHVGDLWDLALQLSARLGALQQQQGYPVGAGVPPAWPDVQQLSPEEEQYRLEQQWLMEQQQLQQQQQMGLMPDAYRDSMGGSMASYPPDAMAVVPTDLQSQPLYDDSLRASPQRPPPEQFDEGNQAEVEFRSEASWPTGAHKKARVTGSSSGGGAAMLTRLEEERSVGAYSYSTSAFESVGGASQTTATGVPETIGEDATSQGGTSAGGATGRLGATRAIQAGGTARAATFDSMTSGLRSVGSATTRDQDVSSVRSKQAVASLHSRKRQEQDEVQERPAPARMKVPLIGGQQPPAVAPAASRPASATSGSAAAAPAIVSIAASPAKSVTAITRTASGAANPIPAVPPTLSPTKSAASLAPPSPAKSVPAAPIIQIPLPPATTQPTADSVEPSPGLPYDNGAYSAESAEEGSCSGEESGYGQRVYTISELHNILEENPRLAQRLTLERERDRWEAEEVEGSPLRSSLIKPLPRPRSPERQSVPGDESSDVSSAPDTPARACEEVVNEYEHANSPIRIRPAQRELMKAQAAKRTEEQQERALEAATPKDEDIGAEPSADDMTVLTFPKSGDPMSIINLIAHKGRLPERPAIIQLSEPPLAQVVDHETQTSLVVPVSEAQTQSVPRHHAASEVLVIPGTDGTQLVFSRELVQPQREKAQQPVEPASPPKYLMGTGVGDERMVAPPNLDFTAAQELNDSMPPYVLMPAATAQPVGASSLGTEAQPQSQASLQQQVDSLRQARQVAAVAAARDGPALMAQLGRLSELRSGGGAAAAAATSGSLGGALPDGSVGGASQDAGAGLAGVMASPPPRPRMVSFIDEPMGPPDRVRLAPNELYKQMQDTLKTYEELDAAELELQQLQNARAIAAVQREAHRIAQRLDQTAVAESQAQLIAQNAEAQALVIAQAQAEMDAKLIAMEENLRNEVRKESLHHLNDVTSMFLQQLTRNKVAHANVQTMSEDLPQPRKEMAVQVEPVHPPPILRHTASSPSPPRPLPTSLRAGSPSSTSPPIIHRGTSPTPPPAAQLRTSLRSPSPSQPAVPTSLRSSPVPAYQDRSRGGSPGPSDGGAGAPRSRVSISNVTSEYTEVFDEDEEEDTEPQARRGQPGRTASRSTYRQTSTLSVPETTYEDEEFEEDVEEESGMYSRGTSRHTTRQPSRVTIRPQVSTMSVAESIYSERPLLKSALRQQTSTTSIPESVEYEEGPARRAPSRGVTNQVSAVSIAESIRSERTTATQRPAPSARRRQSVAESVPYSSAGVSGESGESGSIPESVPQMQASRSRMSVRSRRPRSSAMTSEPGYSMSFEEAEDVEDEVETEEPGTVTGTEVYSEDIAEEPSQPSGRRPAARQPARRGAAATASTRSTEVEDELQTEEPGSYSQDATTVGESGLGTSGSSGRVAAVKPQQLVRPSTAPGHMVTTPVADRTKGKAAATPQSPLLMRVPMEGGLELDDEMMRTYTADAEAQMLAEVTRLQERLAAITAAADTKMAQLEDELGEVTDAQRRQAIIRLQRLVQVQRDADEADLQRQIHAVKADYARQQLYMERLYRLAQITSPAAAAKRTDGTTVAAVATPTSSKRTGAAPAAAPATKAPSRAPAPKRQASVSSSIVEEEYSEPHVKESGSGSIVEEVATTRGTRAGSGSIVEERSTTKHRSGSGSILEESSIPGTGAGRTASVASEVSYEYSGDFEPPSAHTSRRQVLPAGRPAKPARQQSSVMDEIEENLSHRRLGTSGGGMSQSVATEEDVRHRSGSTAGRSSSRQQRGRSSGSEVAESEQYSEDFDTKHADKSRSKGARRRTSASVDLEGGDSELSVMSAALERQQAELQLMLKRREKELRDKERRAKLLAKQAAVEALQKQLAALEARDAKVAPAKQVARTPAAAKPRKDSDVISEGSMAAYSEEQQYGTPSDSVADEVGSSTPQSIPDVRGRAGSVVSESIRSESHAGGHRANRARSSGSVTESVAYTEPEEEEESASYATASVASGSKHRSASRSSEIRAAQRLSALQKAVKEKEKELRRLQLKQEEEALQRRLKELEDQERNLKSGPPPKPPKPPGAAPAAPVQRKAAPAAAVGTSSYGTSGDSAAYSEEFASGTVSGTVPGGYASSSVVDEVPSQSVLRSVPRGGAAAAGSRSGSIVDEYSSDSVPPSSRVGGPAGASGSIVEEVSRGGLGASRSSGGAASSVPRGGSASASGDVYAESFETNSTRGVSVLRDASEILDEAAGGTSGDTGAGAASLDIIQEEGARTASFRSAGRSAGASRAAAEDEVEELEVEYSDEVQELQASRSAAPVGEASGGELDEEEGALAGASVEYSQEDVQEELHSIQDLEAASIEHSASQPEETVQEFMTTADSRSPSAAPSGEASVAEETVNVRDFTRTADTIGASFAPSVHSVDLEPIASGSAVAASVEGSVVYSEPQEQQSPAASGTGEIEDEEPFVVQQRSPSDSEIEEVAAEPASASGERGASGSIVEERAERSAVSASALEEVEPEELEVEYSEDVPEPASAEVEEEEPFVVKERGSSDEEEEEVPEAEVEYSEDAIEPASAEVEEEEEPFVVTERGGSDAEEEVAEEAAGVEVEEDEYTLDDIEVEEEEVDASTRTMAMEVTDTAAETTMPVEEATEEEAYTDSFHTSAVTGTGTGTASGQSGALGTTGDVQDASTLLGQTSLHEVASASSLGGSRAVGREGSTMSARGGAGPSNLGKQASSMSTNTYGEEDFEEDIDASELPGLSAPGDRTALSVVDEEAEPGVSASRAYTDDFPTASADIAASAAPAAAHPAAPEEASEDSAEVEDIAEEEVEYSDDLAAEEEDESFGAHSGAPPGPVLQPAAAAQVGVEASQRYGPVSAGSSGGYSEDFPEDQAEEAEEEEGGEEEEIELPEPILAHKEPSEEVVAAARSAPPPAAAAEPSGGSVEAAAAESGSVFSVEEEALEEVEVEESSADLRLAAAAVAAPAAAPEPEAAADDNYTRDFTLDVEDTAGLSSASAAPRAAAAAGDLTSHPISQPKSPPAGSDNEGAGSERQGSVVVHPTPPGERADSEQEEEQDEEVVEEEYEDDLEEDDGGLDMSDLGLEPPPATRAAPAPVPAAEASAVEPEQEPEAKALGVTGLDEPEMEDSGAIITVPSGRGIRQTRNIESRRWPNREAMLADEEEEEEEEDLDGTVLDLVDMSITAGQGGDLLAMLGADFIEANEDMTPSHSFRLRGDLSSGNSANSGSAFGALRNSLSHRLATLREQQEQEGEEGTEASSEAITPRSRQPALFESEAEGRDDEEAARAAQEQAEAAEAEVEEDVEEVVEEEVDLAASGDEEEEAPFKPAAAAPLAAAAADEEEAPVVESRAVPAHAPEPEAEKPEPEPEPEPPVAPAAAEPSAEYSEAGLEPPSEGGSSGRQSVVEYDLYTSAALAATDSDDLAEYAANFESQAIGEDDDDEAVAAEVSGISASGLSDDLGKYQITAHPESDEEEAMAAAAPAPSAAEVAAAVTAAVEPPPPPPLVKEKSPSIETSEDEVEEEEVVEEVEEEELGAASNNPFSVDESIDRMPALSPHGAAKPPAPIGFPRELSSPTASATAAAEDQPGLKSALDEESEHKATLKVAVEQAPQEPASSPTVSSPVSRRSSANLADETSLGPLPRSGLVGDDEDDDGAGLEYRALYKPEPSEEQPAGLEHEPSGPSPARPDEPPPTTSAAASPPPAAGDVSASVVEEEEPGTGGPGLRNSGLLDQLRAFVGSDDDDEDLDFGASGGLATRHLSGTSLKPALQSLLDQPDEAGVSKGDFESEIEEMLAASRRQSRLQSPYHSREWSEAQTPEGTTPYSTSARASAAGSNPDRPAPGASTSLLVAAAAAAMAAANTSGEQSLRQRLDPDADSEGLTESPEQKEPSRDELADQITAAAVQELVADAVNVMTSIAGGTGELPATQAAGLTVQVSSPRASLSSLQMQTTPKHRLANVSSFHCSDADLQKLEAEEAAVEAASAASAANASIEQGAAAAAGTVSGEPSASASISMSAGDLEGDIELDAEEEVEEEVVEEALSVEGEDEGAGPEIIELPSPLPSESGSISSSISPRRAYEPPGASKLSAAGPASMPALAPEASGRDLALQPSEGDEGGEAGGTSGAGLTSDEDLGWGGADEEEAELEEGWQSGYIAPAMDQATIEREHAPAVATSHEAVSEYVGQVLDQFMEARPEFLEPGADPLSLEGFLAQERRLVDASEAQHIHNKMLYDAVNEALLGIYRAANRVQSQPWLRKNRVAKPLPSPSAMLEQVQKQIKAWSGMRMRDPAEIDKVLVQDAQEDERAWTDLSGAEVEVKREVAEAVWADLVEDTAEVLANLEQLLAPPVTTSFRRRML